MIFIAPMYTCHGATKFHTYTQYNCALVYIHVLRITDIHVGVLTHSMKLHAMQ